nr:MAG TPA: hypothetical protein [Caudoviricetes sp.]
MAARPSAAGIKMAEEGRAASSRPSWPTVLAVFWPPSQICGSVFRFGWRTFRWNYAVSYPLEAKSLLLTT